MMRERALESGIVVRPARADELETIERLLVASALPVAGVAEAMEHFVVAEHGGAIIGVTGLERRGAYALLRSAAVAQEWRGKAVGAELVRRVISEAERNGVTALYLLTTTAEGYFPAFGFSQVEREAVPEEIRSTVEFMDACPASAIAMERML